MLSRFAFIAHAKCSMQEYFYVILKYIVTVLLIARGLLGIVNKFPDCANKDSEILKQKNVKFQMKNYIFLIFGSKHRL